MAENVDNAHKGKACKIFVLRCASESRALDIECVGSIHAFSGTGLYFTRRRVEGANNSELKSPMYK